MTSKPVLVVQHEDECPPAWFGQWLEEAGLTLDVRRPYASGDVAQLPTDLSGHGGLLVLGGHMGANDDDEVPWLTPVKELVREAARDRVPTLGICLGHQLVAVALGGVVTTNPNGPQRGALEQGWMGTPDALLGSQPARGVQWNNDVVVQLPAGAVLLAATPAGEPQAVRHADTVWGVQCHPEADVDVVAPWADEDRRAGEGLAVDAAVAEVRAHTEEMHRSWRRVARTFAGLCP